MNGQSLRMMQAHGDKMQFNSWSHNVIVTEASGPKKVQKHGSAPRWVVTVSFATAGPGQVTPPAPPALGSSLLSAPDKLGLRILTSLGLRS